MSSVTQENKTPGSPVVKTSQKADIEFLQKILRLWENDECLEVNSVVQTPACGPGENMMSVVDRIVVNGTRKDQSPYQISLISKVLVEDQCHQEVFQSVEVFANETRVYKALPYLLGKEQELVPNCVYMNDDLIILEDLKPRGFTMPDTSQSLDFDHAKLVLEALAKFHAASLVLEYNEPERYAKIRSEVKEVLFPSDTEHKGIKSMVSALPSLTIFYLRAGATPEDDHAKEIEYFANKSDKIYSMIKEVLKPKKYAMMCVGDCWTRNLLFKYTECDNGDRKVCEVRLLDFQTARFASVAADILYFLHTSVRHSVIEDRSDDLLAIYHSVLTSKLDGLPENVLNDLSFDWLKNEIKTNELYGLFMSLWTAPATTMDEEHNIDGNTVASLAAENGHTPEYMKDKISAALLTKVHEKCKYFLK